jgi:4-hydroxyphenylacetate 3-monooxygenase
MQSTTGAEHVRSLRDGRAVYLDGKRVDDVTTHVAYRNAVASAAMLYDYQGHPENLELMTFVPDGGTRRVNRAWQMPRNYDELVERRKALAAWAQLSYGFMPLARPRRLDADRPIHGPRSVQTTWAGASGRTC